MNVYYMAIRLLSDATFGRGEGLAGLVNTEIEHDQHGCPFVSGRTLKGLLREECRNIHDAMGDSAERWASEAQFLFGISGDTQGEGTASMHIGAAMLPPVLLRLAHRDVTEKKLTPADLLASLTTFRRQTAVDAKTEAPAAGSLRTERALIRDTYLLAQLTFERNPNDRQLALLSACILATRRGGLGRNRGRGRLQLRLHDQIPADYDDETFTRQYFTRFISEVRS
ncbi:MAG: RAMP superfamily CRISPR-associated protein [Roseiflexaceae bacterium]